MAKEWFRLKTRLGQYPRAQVGQGGPPCTDRQIMTRCVERGEEAAASSW